MQVDSGEISYHIVSINLANHVFIYPTYQLGRYLVHLNVDVKIIKTPQLYGLEGV